MDRREASLRTFHFFAILHGYTEQTEECEFRNPIGQRIRWVGQEFHVECGESYEIMVLHADVIGELRIPARAFNEREDGLTSSERIAMDKTIECYNAFRKLNPDDCHPDDLRRFVDAIHVIQDIIGLRALRRLYPGAYTTINKPWEKE